MRPPVFAGPIHETLAIPLDFRKTLIFVGAPGGPTGVIAGLTATEPVPSEFAAVT